MLEVDLAPAQAPRRAPARITRIGVIVAQSHSQADGIRDYSNRLVTELNERSDIHAEQFSRAFNASATAFDVPASARFGLAQADAVVLQYNPFWYAKRGFAPGLPVALAVLRASRRPPTIALMVHENYIEPKTWKWALMGAWQRAQLRTLQRLSHLQLCSIEAWAEDLRRTAPRVPTYHLPVASNFPDCRHARQQARARLGVGEDRIVLCAFGMRHPGRLTNHIVEAARAVRDRVGAATLLNLGSGDRSREMLDEGLELVSSGYLEGHEVSEMLAASDIFLAPLEDGASTRRGTVMAALQHGLAVVGTNGHLTDQVLKDASEAIVLTPVDDTDQFVAMVARLATDSMARQMLGRSGRQLYEQRFDWPVGVEALLGAIEDSAL